MTDQTLTTEPQITALAEYLAGAGLAPSSAMTSYLGALTPQQLDATEAETGALVSGVAVHDLGWLRRVALRGEDRFRWLSGMVTNMVEALPDRSGTYNLVLNAQGRIQGDACVWRSGDELELEITAEQSEALLAHLDRFIIMDDVELTPLSGQSALGLTGPQAEAILIKLGLNGLSDEFTSTSGTINGVAVRVYRGYGPVVPHFTLWTAVEEIPAFWQALCAAGAKPVGAASIETLRIVEGVPAYGIDIQSRDLAQETAQDRALSFTKGCYLGQEIVERIRSRGQVHRHLRALELTPDHPGELPSIGAELRISGNPEAKPAGAVTSVASLQRNGARRIFAIAMIRSEAEVGNQPLTYPGGIAQILHTSPKLT
ncbi:CAF17-like 4Fe-4S cluster assembly/insertion protein YgfZ [Acidicapsa acidisoli]|uniref:CAF17-like 4Fe-4S cluster assembly/insertion protein YgfZ n=1 Tax=Acidicapsa acidisoli TaxID=1615681 RepID=UPI0021E065D5|nr:folate-binding protein [Acidicapsa acidisoli]